jgi:alkaline phosphatase D
MKRRDFLHTTVIGGGAILVGCPAGPRSGSDLLGVDLDATSETTPETTPDTGPDVPPGPAHAWFPQSVASGDPRPESLVLWTRLEPDTAGAGDLALALEVALDEGFTQIVSLDGAPSMALTAKAADDWCVRARVTGLTPGTVYYYRFTHTPHPSRVGRTKTAPAPDAEVAVRFAVIACQDFGGRYYNTLRHLTEQGDLDFFVHLGDYIYETAGAAFQESGDGSRVVAFSDESGALVLKEGTEDEHLAARSLSNYRDLYKIVKSDRWLQRLHERAPMIAIWDDHEFSDDCWGAHASYTAGRKDELDLERRANADRAWFEHMPVDYPAGPDYVYPGQAPFPDDLRIYRDLLFGKHLHLVMTDLRRHRSDHVIPEDAFPGAVAATEEGLTSVLGAVPDFAVGYVDIATYAGGAYQKALVDNAEALELEAAKLVGHLSVPWVNARVATLDEGKSAGDPGWLDPIDEAGHPRGLAFHQVLKTSAYSSVGSRYLTVAPVFDALSAVRYAQTLGASEAPFGEAQASWFVDTLTKSTRTWKVWGNEYTFHRRVVDLSQAGGVITSVDKLPAGFRQKFYLSAEDWDGLPNAREALFDSLAGVENLVAVTGDIHAFFAAVPSSSKDPAKRLVELVTGAISSGTYKTLLVRQASSDPALLAGGAPVLAVLVQSLLQDPVLKPNPHLAYADLERHGFTLLDVSASELRATFHAIAESEALVDRGDDPELAKRFAAVELRVKAGSGTLEMKDSSGAWVAWDPSQAAWKNA